jgi:hypothetical protein
MINAARRVIEAQVQVDGVEIVEQAVSEPREIAHAPGTGILYVRYQTSGAMCNISSVAGGSGCVC